MSRHPPPTSYGYLAPRGARVIGWECNNEGHCTGDRPAPRSWPHPCPVCGRPVDPTFQEPWAHEAEGHKLRHQSTDRDPGWREIARTKQHVWAYKDACLRGDRAAADAAWRAHCDAVTARWWAEQKRPAGWLLARCEMVRLAAVFGDLDRAVDELLRWYPSIDTRDIEGDHTSRTLVRSFVYMCIKVLERESSIGHPRAAELYAAMRDIAGRIEDMLTNDQHRELRHIDEIRVLRRTRAAIAQARRSAAHAVDGLPPLSWAAVDGGRPAPSGTDDTRGLVGLLDVDPKRALRLVDAVIDTAQTHDDPGPLDELLRVLDRAGASPGLRHLVRARRRVVTGDLAAAVQELERGSGTTDSLARRLRPQLLATHGLLLARTKPDDLDQGIALCRAGRQSGLRWWRRTTAADAGLARLLLWRATSPATSAALRSADIREAARLSGRRGRPWHGRSADDRLLRQEVLAARDDLAGRRGDERRHRAWRGSVAAPFGTVERARIAVAWAEWAVSSGVAEFAAEAYSRLVALASQDAVARYGASAKQRVLAEAQEYAEEAGYWLSRAGRYREAVLALETGRAVGLTEVLGRGDTEVIERLRAAGRADLADEYGQAIVDLDGQEDRASPRLRETWTRLRDVARRVAAVTGIDPLLPEVDYDDIAAQTGDGAIVYLAAARSGGYALVVAGGHDPQYIDLPKLNRATVAGIVAKVLPRTDPSTHLARFPTTVSGTSRAARELPPIGRAAADPMSDGLQTLWRAGLDAAFTLGARGRIVTVVPVGLFNLLPLHAAGEPGETWDLSSGRRHVGRYSAIRYAPNARGLRKCRETARDLAGREQTLLAIDVPDGHGLHSHGHLRYVTRETSEVTRLWTGRPARPVRSCTWAEFRAGADQHTVWHLACHGSAEPGSILDSRLYFADRQVTLEELRGALKPGRRRLAVLSACQTNVTGSAMPNEGVGLPAALIQLGFAGVIATAWAVDDLATTYLMTAFYQRWCREGDEPAVALSRAQHWLRTASRADLIAFLPGVDPAGDSDDHPYGDPRYWAAFAYTGA